MVGHSRANREYADSQDMGQYINSSKGWLTYNNAEYEIMQRLLDNFNILNISLWHTDNVFLILLNIPKPINRKTSTQNQLNVCDIKIKYVNSV